MDKEVLREIWHGQLPLCFKLHPDDVSGMHQPDPYYMMVSRVTYFPLVLDRVVKYFYRFIDQNKQVVNDMWLDYEGQPIKWQYPVGLSWDLFGSSYDLPWRLMLHFSEFPAKELVRCNTKSSMETNYISNIKEADHLKHKGNVIKNMVKKDHNVLWSSLVNDKFDQFFPVNKRLMERTDNELFRYIPYRLYFPDHTFVQRLIKPCTTEHSIFKYFEKTNNNTSSPNSPSSVVNQYDTDIVINSTHKCSHTTSSESSKTGTDADSNHRCSTMLDLIQVSFINRMNDLLLSSPSTCGEDEQSKDSLEENQTSKGLTSDNELIDVGRFKYRFISHGIEIPLDTPLQWLSEHLSYPDNFLHICAVVKDKSEY